MKEIKKYLMFISKRQIRGVHIGGGTPSLLTLTQIEKLISGVYKLLERENFEIVFEAHPQSLSYEKIDYLSRMPSITLNLGIQTFDEVLLTNVNRCVKKDEMINKIVYAQNKLNNTVGIDIIAGLPGASTKSVLSDLEKLLELSINHIALYPLRIEKGAYLFNSMKDRDFDKKRKKKLEIIMKDAIAFLEIKGYNHSSLYEWEKEKRDSYGYSKHQRNGGEWIGIGVGAYSYFQRQICKNISNMEKYKEIVNGERIVYDLCKYQNTIAKVVWDICFALRKGYISQELFSFQYGDLIQEKINNIIELLIVSGWANLSEDNCACISIDGMINIDMVDSLVERMVLYNGKRSRL